MYKEERRIQDFIIPDSELDDSRAYQDKPVEKKRRKKKGKKKK